MSYNDSEMQRERNAQINGVVGEWYRTRQLAPLPQADAEMIDNIIKGALDSQYTLDNLDYGYNILVSFKKLKAHITRYFEANPDFKTDHNQKVLDQWATEHPQASAYDFNNFIEGHRLDGTFTWNISTDNLVKILRTADKAKIAEMKLQFGEAAVNQAWDVLQARIHKWSAKQAYGEGRSDEDEQARKETRQKQNQFFETLKERSLQTQCEAIVANYRPNNNWMDVQDGRQILAELKAYKPDGETVDWGQTKQLLETKAAELQRELQREGRL